MLFTTPGAAAFISGVIMHDETIRQKSSSGMPLPQVLERQGIVPGIKVDTGARPLAGSPEELVTEGFDGLRDRLAEYRSLGARFAKWRAVISIGDGRPSSTCVGVNAHQASVPEVAAATLSLATAHLNAINRLPGPRPWMISFSYGRSRPRGMARTRRERSHGPAGPLPPGPVQQRRQSRNIHRRHGDDRVRAWDQRPIAGAPPPPYARGVTPLRSVTAIVLGAALLALVVAAPQAQELLRISGSVQWIAGSRMQVMTTSESPIAVDLTQADQSSYQMLRGGDSVIVDGVLSSDGRRFIASGIWRDTGRGWAQSP